MSWRTVVITGVAKLDYKMEYLVVRKKEGINRIHISEIGQLIIESTSVSLTAVLISELVKNKVKVIFCDEKHNPHSELTPYYGSYDSSLKIRTQILWDKHIKQEVWTLIVREKIKNQGKILCLENHYEEAALLNQYVQELKLNDDTNREGHAAKVYFNALFGNDFSRSDENSINAALNYGYEIILSCFNREISAAGYLTQVGIHHDNMFNKFNLSSDLMEPFRYLVDKTVLAMKPEKFEKEEKYHMLEVLHEVVKISGKTQRVSNAIKIYCKSVFDAINEKDTSLICFYQDEL